MVSAVVGVMVATMDVLAAAKWETATVSLRDLYLVGRMAEMMAYSKVASKALYWEIQ
jgi:hypothetical protein